MKCPKCKQELPEDVGFCTGCGTPMKKKRGMFWKAAPVCLLVAVLIGAGVWAVASWRDKTYVRLQEEVPQMTQPVPATQQTKAPTEPPTEAPTEPEPIDYAVYPEIRAHILGDTGSDRYHVWRTDQNQYEETDGVDIITGPNPYYWEMVSYDTALYSQVQDYVTLLQEEPYNLELVYTKDMGETEVYLFRYNGSHKVYPLDLYGYVLEDGGDYHMAFNITERFEYEYGVVVEAAVGYGLEPIDWKTAQNILDGQEYVRTSNCIEQIEAENADQTFYCYYCEKQIYPKEGTYLSNQQIVYCDDCYEDLFGTEPTE